MTGAALILIVAALLLVRLGWEGRRTHAALGWAGAAIGLLILTLGNGAWGLAVGIVVGIATALAMVLHAGWTSPARVRRPAREAPAVLLPRRWPDVGRRVLVFVLVVPVAFAAAQWLAFGTQAFARRAGWGEADATVLALLLQPTLWGAMMSWQMTRDRPAAMIALPAAAAAIGTILWGAA